MDIQKFLPEEGIQKAKKLLYNIIQNQTLLFLSGGETPKTLYQELAKEKSIKPAAVALIDERFGSHLHKNSNEKKIRDTGLIDYFEGENIPFNPILKSRGSCNQLTEEYDTKFMFMVMKYPKKIAIMGIGTDGHTAGIAPNRKDFRNPIFKEDEITLVSSFNDTNGPFKQRITLTFAGLSLIDQFIIIAFGENKNNALKQMFQPGEESDIPARFYLRKEISLKTTLITDQKL